MKRKIEKEALAVRKKILDGNRRENENFVRARFGRENAEERRESRSFTRGFAIALPIVLAVLIVGLSGLLTSPLVVGQETTSLQSKNGEKIANRALAKSGETFECERVSEEELKETFLGIVDFDFRTGTAVRIQKVRAQGDENETFYNVRFLNEDEFIWAEIVLVKTSSEYEYEMTFDKNKRIRKMHNDTQVIYQTITEHDRKNNVTMTSAQAKIAFDRADIYVLYENYETKRTDVYDWIIKVLIF